jgi:acetyl-CoA C-acetyltransferase
MDKKIVLCHGIRTPIGHLSKSFSNLQPEYLLQYTIAEMIKQADIDPAAIDGAIIGWVGQGSHAPNIARIGALMGGVPEKSYAMTIQCNCVSGIEAVASAARHIHMGEGDLYIAGGTESMSNFPYTIRGGRHLKPLRTIDSVRENWDNLWEEDDVVITDCMVEGLTDPVKRVNMAQTAEICAQKFGISREEQDKYTIETFGRCLAAEENGFYDSHVVPVVKDGETILEKDEYIMLRKGLLSKPAMFAKAPVLFNTGNYKFRQFYDEFGMFIGDKQYVDGETLPTVTLFNSCARSDAAAAVIVTTEERAKELGLTILAELKSWAYSGNNPALMGIAPAHAAPVALKRAGMNFDDLDVIELHEAFAATVLSVFHVGKTEYGHDWHAMWEKGALNHNGGSIPMGHPLAATGTRLLLNMIYQLQAMPSGKTGLAAACAAGGMGGAMILEKR